VDKAGNLSGTTVYGGGQCGCGVVYKLTPGAHEKWTYTVLHTFAYSDGAQPVRPRRRWIRMISIRAGALSRAHSVLVVVL
jgi:uncharacterized repeat protein (TIGR03803 family)